MTDTYMIIHFEIPHTYNETVDIQNDLVKYIGISNTKPAAPAATAAAVAATAVTTTYSNCAEYTIEDNNHNDAIHKKTHTQFDTITITSQAITAAAAAAPDNT